MARGPSLVSGKVWEWQRDDGGYSPFPPQNSAQIETAYNTGSGTCSLGSQYTVYFHRMVQRNNSSGFERNIQQTAVTLPASPIISAYWSWNEKSSNYVLYSVDTIIDIELAYQKRPHGAKKSSYNTVDLSKCRSQLPYTINFSDMSQKRHGYGTKRKIRRDPIPGGQSLQSLLQPAPFAPTALSVASVTPSIAGTSSGACAYGSWLSPATNMLQAGATGTGPPPSTHSATVDLTSASGGSSAPDTSSAKPLKKKGGKKDKKRKTSPPLGRGGKNAAKVKAGTTAADEVPPYATVEKTLKPEDDGPCPICMCELSEQSGYEEEALPVRPIPYAPPADLCKLRKCGHMMHRACLLMMMKSESAKKGLSCPTCKVVYGVKTGDMPDGTMEVRNARYSLPGYEGYGCIEIIYNFQPGVHNGCRYRADGFPRICYIPDCPKGQKVLKLLRVAWERRLTFTIGSSVTTGAANTVVWNEIHHKTESMSNHSGHGYPDPNYLDNVLMELSSQGVVETEPIVVSSDDDSL